MKYQVIASISNENTIFETEVARFETVNDKKLVKITKLNHTATRGYTAKVLNGIYDAADVLQALSIESYGFQVDEVKYIVKRV